ncbi:7829_t:CDS:2, partial [Acaulospora colombiana]
MRNGFSFACKTYRGVPTILDTTSLIKPTGPAVLPVPENRRTGHPNAVLNAYYTNAHPRRYPRSKQRILRTPKKVTRMSYFENDTMIGGLTKQASQFEPLDCARKLDKTKAMPARAIAEIVGDDMSEVDGRRW